MTAGPRVRSKFRHSHNIKILVAWIQNKNNTFSQQNASIPESIRPKVNLIEGLSIDVTSMLTAPLRLEGNARARFYDTSSGLQIAADTTLSCPGACKVRVPPFSADIALVVRSE